MRRLLANTTAFYGAQLLARLINFGYLLVLARTLVPDAFGHLNLALSVLVIADTCADLGLSRLALREMSRDPEAASRYLSALSVLKALTAALCYAGSVAFAWFGGYPAEVTAMIALSGLGLVFTGSSMLFESALHVRQRFGFVSLAHLTLSLLQAATGFLVLGAGGGALAIAGTAILTNGAYCAIVFVGLRRAGIVLSPTVAPSFWRACLVQSAAYGAMAILSILSTRVELLVLGWFAAGADLGAYSIALKLMEAALLAPVTLGIVVAPTFARHHAGTGEELASLYLRVLRFGLLAAIPGALVAGLVVGPVTNGLVGGRYAGLEELLRVMFAAFPFAAAHCLNIGLLLGSDRQRGTLALVAGLLALQVGISATLVSQLGTDGAALAFLAINVVSGIASTLCVWRWFMRGARLGQAILPPLAAGAVLLGLALLGQPVAALIAFAAIGGIVALGLPLPAYRETAPA
ncbi:MULTISPECIES: oligosaccharide flippase family protein [Methylobacterium]|uniref:Polysaccharide biosynthesis protein n=2 Tax=Pseudomonadota TaxID=1224 RepID=A0ABQ4SSK4_9HYPH|nr:MULTISPECIES: oligosaccharide flippase family protein [Methylobacterium]PIU07052.1 MAG: hypothetical protein COT56_06560 [Methylobacterium sp. CG09_land_8_20_14_0_10_71_15]PIU12257.1 MAG: hypothetical protein COT28_15760 [Methylobacterium sp. CG08_land_8_20_14_0_20_71_15]GBU16740.1 hypothetical protein AwMethylo_09550 [Methylobacterium sp.]GJE05470.1 hypothetical protein AOPFMNJM_0770 [Methylobacterium jeotgali]